MINKLNCKIVFGSWKAYNENGVHALGSNWLNMDLFDSVDEVIEELKKEGWTDEELEETFIQDYEANANIFNNCDNINIERAIEILIDIDDSDHEAEAIKAYLENVNNDIYDCLNAELYFYEGESMEDVAYNLLNECYQIPEYLENYIDYEAYARDLKFDGCYYETFNGVLEVR